MECVAFHFLINRVGRHIMAIFQDLDVKIHQAQIVKEWSGGPRRIIFTHDERSIEVQHLLFCCN